VDALLAAGAREVAVRTLDYVFRPTNPLTERLFARLPPGPHDEERPPLGG
jgi:hypothetical protein